MLKSGRGISRSKLLEKHRQPLSAFLVILFLLQMYILSHGHFHIRLVSAPKKIHIVLEMPMSAQVWYRH